MQTDTTPAADAASSLVTTQQLASYLQIPVGSIHRWRYRGTGPRAIRVGRHLRFRREDVDAWLDEQASRDR